MASKKSPVILDFQKAPMLAQPLARQRFATPRETARKFREFGGKVVGTSLKPSAVEFVHRAGQEVGGSRPLGSVVDKDFALTSGANEPEGREV